jgi:hypothetical protein
LYRNNGNSNHWLAVQCEGRFSNASAIGARLELIADIGGKPVRQIREISGGGGYGSQNGLRAHFGLGPTTSITSLRLRWPSGIVQELTRVPVDQMLTVREPPQLLSVPQQQDGIFRGEFRGGRNRIYEVQATENLMDWTLLTTLTNRDGISAFTDVMGPNGAVRFYRVQER